MGHTLLHGALLLDPEADRPRRADLLIDGVRIAALLEPGSPRPEDAEVVDLGGAQLAPGFVDLHFHGGWIFAPADEMQAVLRADCASLLTTGTTAFLPTSVAWPAPELAARVGALAGVLPLLGDTGAVPLGLHLEGPWIHPGAAGAQPEGGIRDFDASEGDALLARAEGLVRITTFAPELTGAASLQKLLEARGVVAALGHSLADAGQVDAAVARGARHVTHLFNAMGPLHQRRPGLAAAALADERLSCDLICDGVHVSPEWVRVAHRAKGDQLICISDRVEPPDGGELGSGALHEDGSAWRLADGRLAGSRLGLDRALRNAMGFAGMSLQEAVAACTLHPARLLGIEAERGTLRPGARADLVVLDAEARLRETWLAGRRRYAASGRV